jgi:hypothetical protein
MRVSGSMRPDRRTLVPVLAIAAVALASCGGGSGATQPIFTQVATVETAKTFALNEYLVNPGATWKVFSSTLDGNVGSLTQVDLRPLVPAGQSPGGQVFEMQVLGTYDAASLSSTPQIKNDVTALFRDAAGTGVPLAATTVGITLATLPIPCFNGPPDDPFPGDFIVPTAGVTRILVPPGSTHVQLSVEDCYFQDNMTTASNPLRLSIKLVTP